MYKEHSVGKLPSGKEIMYGIQDNNPLCTLYFKGGGQLPAELDGMWNDLKKAQKAVEAYLCKGNLTKEAQAEKDVKTAISEAKKRPNKTKVK